MFSTDVKQRPLTPDEMATVSSHNVLQVHHNQQGHITSVEARRAQG